MIPLLFAAAAGSVAKGASTIFGGVAESRANKARALGAQIERDMALLRGKQIGERSREDLQTALGNIDAIRSARGANLDSQTGQLIEKRTIKDSYRDQAVATLSELTRAGAAEQARRGYRTAARWSVPMAAIGAAGDFASAGAYGKLAFARNGPPRDLDGLY